MCESTCVFVHHIHAVPTEARRGHQIPANAVTGSGELPDASSGN